MSSLKNKQSLLSGNPSIQPESPIITSYASDPDYHHQYGYHHQHGGYHLYGASPPMIHRRTHRHRNKKYHHKSKQKKLLNVNKLEDINGVWISKIIKQDNIENKKIHCISVCKSYKFDEIQDSFNDVDYFIFARYEDALHFKMNNNQNINNDDYSDVENIVDETDIFVFQHEGVIIFWNLEKQHRNDFVSLLEKYQIDYPIEELSQNIIPQTDDFCYELGQDFYYENYEITLSLNNCFDKNYIQIWNDYVDEYSFDNKYGLNIKIQHNQYAKFINDNKNNEDDDDDESDKFMVDRINWNGIKGVLMMQKLAISFGLAQSLKLTVFEVRIEEMIEYNQDIPKQMAVNGKIKLKHKEVARRMGRLYIARSELNLHCSILDTPEHFYENDLFGKEYEQVRQYLNVDKRLEIINSRFDLLHELLEIVKYEQEHDHGTKLEWIVIWLIVVEVILGLIELLKHQEFDL